VTWSQDDRQWWKARPGGWKAREVGPVVGPRWPAADGTEGKYLVRVTGRVKWFDDNKGYGFITPDDGQGDCFVHYSAIQSGDAFKTLSEGDRVEFELGQGDKGPVAKNVVKLEG